MHGRLKVLGLALLALASMMAISASAAQAKWLIKLGPNVVDLVEIGVKTPPGALLVPELGLEIQCTGGAGTAHLEASNELKDLLVNAGVSFTGCTDPAFSEVCDVHGAGDPAGTIKAKGTGTGFMTGSSDVKISASSTSGSPFADVQYSGGECPLAEIDGRTFGNVVIEIENPGEHVTTHGAKVIEQNLTFGENSAELHDGEGNPVKGTATHPEEISITLSNL